MAKNSKQTSKAVASKASKVLRDGRFSKTSKSVAGGALAQTRPRQNGWMSANDIRELENLDRIPAEFGGDLYLINGNMTKLEDAGIFAARPDTSKVKEEEDEEQEVLELEESKDSKPRKVRSRRTSP